MCVNSEKDRGRGLELHIFRTQQFLFLIYRRSRPCSPENFAART